MSRLRGLWYEAALLVGFLAVTAALWVHWQPLLDLDLAVRDLVDANRPRPAEIAALVLNFLGQGTPIILLCAAIAGVLAWRRRSIRPLFPVVATWLAIYLLVGPWKVITDRAAPHKPEHVEHRERFFSDEASMSYPSGHVVNAVVLYWLLVLLVAEFWPVLSTSERLRRAVRVVPVVVVSVVTTYLGFHWLTDTVAGLLLGLFIAGLLNRVDWARIARSE